MQAVSDRHSRDRQNLLPSVAASQEWVARGREFKRAFEEISAHYREVVDLVILQGASYADAAEQMHCLVVDRKSRISRAKQHLAELLGDSVSQAASI